MPWFKVDDAFAVHPKTIKAGNTAIGLWVRAGSWSAQQLRDGHIPSYVVPMLGGNESDAAQLVDVGLWEAAEDGYQFRSWLDFQPSKAAIEAERVAARDRQRRAREAASAKRHGVSHGVTQPELPTSSRSPHPIPSHPIPQEKEAADADGGFAVWYEMYPRKDAKGAAVKAYKAAIKKADASAILAGLERQLPMWRTKERQFIPLPGTWLNSERWADEVAAQPGAANDAWARARRNRAGQ